MHLDQINQQRRDALCRISQQGLEQAAEMLSKLLQQSLEVDVADAWMADRAPAGNPTEPAGIGIYMAISGQLNGGLLLFFPESSATRISCQLLRKQSIEDLLHEPASSTLKEVGNILASAFLASLEQQLGLRSLPAPPEIARATIAQLLKDRQQTGADHCMIVRTRLISNLDETAPLQGAIYLLPQPEALQKLIDKLSAD